MTCRIPIFYSVALSLPYSFSSAASKAADIGKALTHSLASLPHRTPLLSERIEMLKLKPNAPYPLPKQKQMRGLRPVAPDTKVS